MSDIGRGKKQCPSCQEVVGARAHVCPSCFHEFEVVVKEEKPKFYDEGGRGRKQCVCSKFVGVMLKQCPNCDHVFDGSEPKPEKLAKGATYDEGGRGRKQCPGCEKYVGAKTKECVCGHVFEKEVVEEKPATVKTYDEGGRGRKECPECKVFVGRSAEKCNCGHTFPAEPIVVDRVENEGAFSQSACGCGKKITLTPAGLCPVKLTGTTSEAVNAWIAKMLDAGHAEGVHYAPSALRYFASMFYDRDTPEFNTVCNYILADFVSSTANQQPDDEISSDLIEDGTEIEPESESETEAVA